LPASFLAVQGLFLLLMRTYEYRLSARIYGRHKPDLCYTKANNQYTLYDDTVQPRIEIARVFWGDKGWTFSGLMNATILDSFGNAKHAMFAAFSRYRYSQDALKKAQK
jgi:hypothetical protein